MEQKIFQQGQLFYLISFTLEGILQQKELGFNLSLVNSKMKKKSALYTLSDNDVSGNTQSIPVDMLYHVKYLCHVVTLTVIDLSAFIGCLTLYLKLAGKVVNLFLELGMSIFEIVKPMYCYHGKYISMFNWLLVEWKV